MPVYFTNPVLAQQRLADDQLPMQQEALRLQELAQLLQASQQNQRTQSEERQNRERVGAQRYQTETWGGVSREQNENVRRRDDAATLHAINALALERERMIKEAELEKGRQLTSKEIAEIQGRRSLMRPQDALRIERENQEIEFNNNSAIDLADRLNRAAKLAEEEDLKRLAKKYKGYLDFGPQDKETLDKATAEIAKRRMEGKYLEAASAAMGGKLSDFLGVVAFGKDGLAKPRITQKISLQNNQSASAEQGSGNEIAKLLGLVGGLSEAELSQRIPAPSFGYDGAASTPAVWRPGMDDGLYEDRRPATVNVDQFGRPIPNGSPEEWQIPLTNTPTYRGFKVRVPGMAR